VMLHRTPKINQAKIDWVNSKLDKQDDLRDLFSVDDEAIKHTPMEYAIHAAWGGDIEPLKKLYPELEPFLVARKRLKNKPPLDPLTLVAWDVRRIRIHWKNHPDKKIQGAMAAIEIAIARWDDGSDEYKELVTVDAVINRLKPSGPSGKHRR
jgi:hypothetical protein